MMNKEYASAVFLLCFYSIYEDAINLIVIFCNFTVQYKDILYMQLSFIVFWRVSYS